MSKAVEKCGNCGSKENDKLAGGRETCFHCADCGWLQCFHEYKETLAGRLPLFRQRLAGILGRN